jgi:hypothetical protein
MIKYGIRQSMFSWLFMLLVSFYYLTPLTVFYMLYNIITMTYPYNIILGLLFMLIGTTFTSPLYVFRHSMLSLLAKWDRSYGFHSVEFFNTVPLKSELTTSTIMIAPHGSSFIPMTITYDMVYRQSKLISYCVINNLLKLIPFIDWIMTITSDNIGSTPENIEEYIMSNNESPLLIYPGGIKDVFVNSTYNCKNITVNLKGLCRLFNYHVEFKRKIIPALCLNESDICFQPKCVVDVFTYINKFLRMGIPTPFWTEYGLLMMSDKPVKILYGEVIYPDELDTNQTLKTKYINALEKLMEKAKLNGWTNKNLVILQ